MNLDKLRGKIDALDSKIIELFNKRANVVKEIGAIKNRKNSQIYAADRERQVFEKIRIAKMLEKMRVDVIEAGFAIASPGDFDAVRAVAKAVKDSTVCSLARALDKDIDRAGESLRNTNSPRIHTFIATSDIHMKMKDRKSVV